MIFARMFKRVREDALQFTQEDLADALGCSRQHISRVERGISEYCHSELLALSGLSGVPAAAFLVLRSCRPWRAGCGNISVCLLTHEHAPMGC